MSKNRINEFILSAGYVYGGLNSPEIMTWLIKIGMKEAEINGALNFFRSLHSILREADTYEEK